VSHHDHTGGRQRRRTALLAAALIGAIAGYVIARNRYRIRLAAVTAQANHDPLTGLPNRRRAVAEVHARLATGPFLLALLDLNDFKTVNDTYGHLAGDDLLSVVAARLYVAVAPDGFVARLAGDEFLVLLPDHGGDPAAAVVPVLTVLAEPLRLATATLRPSACAGVATTASGAASWRQLIAHADQALYRAKHAGAGVAVYDPRHDTATTNTPTISPAMHRPHTRHHDRRRHHPGIADPNAETAPDWHTGPSIGSDRATTP
jgi:diguanylate cyclase (GGDEF)-like protein